MRRSLHVVFGLVVVLTAAAGCTGSEPPAPPPAPTAVALGGHQVDAGLVAAVDAFFADDLGGSYRNRRSLLVTIGGQTLMERHDAGSSCGVDVQRAVGGQEHPGHAGRGGRRGGPAAAGRHRSDELLPAYRALMSPGLRAVTLRQLLSMSSGLPFTFYPQVFGPDVPHDVDWVRTILTTGQQQPAGRFEYSNGGTHLIAAALQGAVGPLLDYARRTLFDPLGIDTTPAADGVARPENIPAYDAARFSWPTDPQGIHLGGGGQKLTATDLAKLGQLWLAGGRWNGRQLVPVDYLTRATTPADPRWAGPRHRLRLRLRLLDLHPRRTPRLLRPRRRRPTRPGRARPRPRRGDPVHLTDRPHRQRRHRHRRRHPLRRDHPRPRHPPHPLSSGRPGRSVRQMRAFGGRWALLRPCRSGGGGRSAPEDLGVAIQLGSSVHRRW